MRLVYIANRLPVRIEKKGNEPFHLRPSPGGLASGLNSYLTSLPLEQKKEGSLWAGWPGSPVEEADQKLLTDMLLHEHSALPIFLSTEQVNSYYNGFCNKVIWPLFHYFLNFVEPSEEYWQMYREVNKQFALQIAPFLKEDDLVGVHDYQLLLLPQYLREIYPNLAISLFLHIPFPSGEIFRLLPTPWRREILEGMLGADLIGFHTHEYRQHFLMTALRSLGVENRAGKILMTNRLVDTGVFPMGIDVQKFHTASISKVVEEKSVQLKKSLGDKKLIFSVDRLDYTKGIANRLLGYEQFLKKHPEWHGKVTLVVSSEPSRVDIDQYKAMKRSIDELIGRINGLYGNLVWQPILYQFTSLSFEDIVALYKASDIALITPLRDGMNLIAKEYIASLSDYKGVLILSEMAGAAKELKEALSVNPLDTEEVAQAIYQGLTMPLSEQKKRNKSMRKRLEKYDVRQWANDLNESLINVKKEQQDQQSSHFSEEQQLKLTQSYVDSSRRLILLDYDGTLVPYANKPHLARPTKKVLNLLIELTKDYRNEVVLMSGRDKKTLDKWLNIPKLTLIAEHGVWKKERNEYYWKMMRKFSSEWKSSFYPLLSQWVDRVPGSFIEEKEYSLAWHYRLVDQPTAQSSIKEILFELTEFASTTNAEVIHGNKVIEVKNIGADKGTATQQWLMKKDYDFILAIGDDTTDEDMFEVLPKKAFTIKVGEDVSRAQYRVGDSTDVLNLLETFITHSQSNRDERIITLPSLSS